MVHVDVNVQNPLVVFEQLQNAKHDVVYVAEPGRLRFFGVMETTTPVDANF